MKNKQNNQKAKNCGNKNCGSKATKESQRHDYSHGGNND